MYLMFMDNICGMLSINTDDNFYSFPNVYKLPPLEPYAVS